MRVGDTYSTRSYAASHRRAPALFSSSVDCWFQAEPTLGSPPVTDDFGGSWTTFLRSPHHDRLALPHAPLWGRISPPLGVRSTFFSMPGLHRILTADDKTMRATLLLLIEQSIRGVVRNFGSPKKSVAAADHRTGC
jgi:hypothetical protein